MEISPVLAITQSVSAIAAVGLGGFNTIRLVPLVIKRNQFAIAWSIFWACVLSYGVGKGFEAWGGPEFLRYHLNDFGFVAVWGGLVCNPNGRNIFSGPTETTTRAPILGLRIGISVALVAGLLWEVFTGLVLPNYHADTTMVRYTGFDYLDSLMYVLCFGLLWWVAPRMYYVEAPAPKPTPTPQPVRSIGHYTPKATPTIQPRPRKKKRRK